MKINFQAYVTPETKLFICYRTLNLAPRFSKCNEIKVEMYNEWKNYTINKVYQSQPYQIIFRAFGSNKDNIVAIINLFVQDGLLCKNRKIRNSEQNQIKVITYEDWQKVRKGNEPVPQVRPRILLVVSEHVESSTEMENSEIETTLSSNVVLTTPIITTTPQTILTTTTLKTSISKCLDDFCTEKESSEEEREGSSTERSESKDDTSETLSDKATTAKLPPPSLDAQNVPSLGQWVQLLKNVAPIIPIIPSLINSLKYNESPPISSTATFNNQYGSNPDSSLRNEEKVFSWKPGETRRAPTPIVPLAINQIPNKNTFGIGTNNNLPLDFTKISTENPSSSGGASSFKQDLNLSALTVNELKTLETIHKKIFPISGQSKPNIIRGESRRKIESRKRVNDRIINYHEVHPITTTTSTAAPPVAAVVVFEKPKQQLSDVRTSVSQNLKYLTPQMIDELNMVSNLPDLEVLTDGLDLSLLNKPGGFSILKQQFMERLIKRLPFKDDDTDLLRAARYRS
uniref:Uncharacterized protein n=1 Tax=Panagrolaimus sp. ES5 TaxID=591445 RepID=A0AC34F7F6_9BILA